MKFIKSPIKKMSEGLSAFKSDIYGEKERKRTAGNYAETIAMAIPTVIYANPITIGIGLGLSAVAQKAQTMLGAKLIEDNLERHPPEHKYSPNLQTMMDRLYDISGLDVEENPVYDFKAKKSSNGKKNPLAEAIDKMSLIPNAAASNINVPVIIISEALLELLTDEEEYAVLAHEFVHASGEHQKVTMPKKFIAGAATATNSIVRIMEFLSSGIVAVGASVASSLTVGAAASYAAAKPDGREKQREMYKELGLALKTALKRSDPEKVKAHFKATTDIAKELAQKEKAETPEQLLQHKRTKLATKTASQIAGVGVVSAFNPVYLPVYAATTALNKGLQVSNKRLSRIFEFHADEAAVNKYEANPLALVTALRKITAIVERSQRNANGFASSDVQVSGLAKKWAKMNATHPPVSERAAALSEIARSQGFTAEQIKEAVEGNIDISNIPDMPLEMAEQAAMMLHTFDHQMV